MTLTIALPILNEAAILERTADKLSQTVAKLPSNIQTTIILADNGSTDSTPDICQYLQASKSIFKHLQLKERGKGLAIKEAWNTYPADHLIFMDADLATDLEVLPRLLSALSSFDLSIGSRYHPDSRVTRPLTRKIFSLGYRAAIKTTLKLPITDAPCGCKAIRGPVWQKISPHIQNNRWFFDTELLFHAHRLGHTIAELPITWTDGGPYHRPSKAIPINIIKEYLSELSRLRRIS